MVTLRNSTILLSKYVYYATSIITFFAKFTSLSTDTSQETIFNLGKKFPCGNHSHRPTPENDLYSCLSIAIVPSVRKTSHILDELAFLFIELNFSKLFICTDTNETTTNWMNLARHSTHRQTDQKTINPQTQTQVFTTHILHVSSLS